MKQFINMDDYRVKQNRERDRERKEEREKGRERVKRANELAICLLGRLSSPHISGKKNSGEDSQAHNKGEYSHSRPPIKKIIMQM